MSNFELNDNYHIEYDIFLPSRYNNESLDDSDKLTTKYGYNVMIDNIPYDNNYISNNLEDVTVDSNWINVEHDNIDNINTENLLQIDIRSKQEMMNKYFFSLFLSQEDKTEINLFHLLKSFNTPLVLVDQVID